MGLSVKQVLEAQGVINALLVADRDNKYVLASATRIKLAGNLRKTRPVVEDYQNEHKELVKRLGEPIKDEKTGKDTGAIKVKPENQEEFTKENEGMLNAVTEVWLNPVEAWQLSGVSKAEFENPETDASKHNQIPVDVYASLISVGLVKE